MKKTLMVLATLFTLQNLVALADQKPEHKMADKTHEMTVGNDTAAKSGATADSKTVKEAKEGDKAMNEEAADAGKADKKDKKEKKAHKEKKAKKQDAK